MIGPGLPHDRPPLSKRALRTGRLPLFADAQRLTQIGITHLDGVVRDVDLGHRRLTVSLSDGSADVVVEAPSMVWATGLRYPKPPIPGFGQAEQNSTGDGLLSLFHRLQQPGQNVVVVGAGLIGTETAATLASDHHVTLVDVLDHPLARFLPRISEAAEATLAELGVRFIGGCLIDATEHGPDGWLVSTIEGELHCDILVSAAGFASSLPPELTGGDSRALTIPADQTLRVIGHDSLWACGDCVSFPHPRWGRIAIPHWDHAIWSGRHVAASIMGSNAPYVRDPYFFSDIGPLRIQQVGLPDQVCDWSEDDSLIVGRDAGGAVTCVLLMGAPTRLLEARQLVESAA